VKPVKLSKTGFLPIHEVITAIKENSTANNLLFIWLLEFKRIKNCYNVKEYLCMYQYFPSN
jgi:hypothetical protein